MKTELVDYDLDFSSLTIRESTDMLVIHHTGSPYDDDMSAAEIHLIHLGMGWAGIGYHFVIRKDGTVEIGRPQDCIGSHAYGENYRTIGIHICGNFELVAPTKEQIEALAKLCADLCTEYKLIPNAETIKGHQDLMATACPGSNLYNILDIIRGKAIWYQHH